jgi:hypothetical protein
MNRQTSYVLHIRPLFRPIDIDHMKPIGIDLGSYADVKSRANDILLRLQDKSMPTAGTSGPWPDEWIGLFARWIAEGHQP